jgi:PhnB protein
VRSITPYLTVKGAAQALEFYKKASGASDIFLHPADGGKRILHARMTIKGGAP